MKLTERRIRDLKAGPKRRIEWDSDTSGLGVRVEPTGRKSFLYDYRDAGGKQRRVTLGRCDETSLAAARARVAEERATVREGGADLKARRLAVREAPTVAEGVERYFADHAPRRVALGRLSPRSVADYRKQSRHVLRALGGLKAAAVTRRDVERMADPLRPVQRNRVLAFASLLFNLFEAWEWREQNANPCRRVERARETPRDRVLTADELARLADALSAMPDKRAPAVAAVRMAALTGLRIGEVCAMRWEHVAASTGRLAMPETKTGAREHVLPSAATALLGSMRRRGPWCFTTTGDAPLTYKVARKCFADAALAAGLADARLHDLRRTVMTAAAAAGASVFVMRDLLGHRTVAMAQRYVRAVDDPVNEARQRVGAEIAAKMAGEPAADVVPLPEPNRGR